MKEKLTGTALPDLDLHLFNVKSDDALTNKLLMLIEGVYGLGVKHSIKKNNYTEQRYYQLLKEFKNLGSDALIEQKRGPKNNSRRSEKIIQQIIQHKFLDPNASAADIAQKLSKAEMPVSIRSIERTIQEYGLQKKFHQQNPANTKVASIGKF